jgi:arginine:ornithine antiporter/lysine permease
MALIPFLLVALYGVKLVRSGQTYDMRPEERRRDLILAGIASAYTLFLVVAGGVALLLLSAVLYGPGTALYFWARRERGEPVFKPVEWAIFAVVVVAALLGIYQLATGYIDI